MCNVAGTIALLDGTAARPHLRRKSEIVRATPEEDLERYLLSYLGRFYDVMFAGSNSSSPNRFTETDIEAIRNLSVSTTGAFKEWLFSEIGQAATGSLLSSIPVDIDIQNVSAEEFQSLLGGNGVSPTSQLWRLLVDQLRANGQPNRQGIQVVASKLIAGKRPRLVPITDSFVRVELGISSWSVVWSCYHTLLTDPTVFSLVEKLRFAVATRIGALSGPLPNGVNPLGLSAARILDLVAWCFHQRRIK